MAREVVPTQIYLPASTNMKDVYEPDVLDRLSLNPDVPLSTVVDLDEMVRYAKVVWDGKDLVDGEYRSHPPDYEMATPEGPMRLVVLGAEDSPNRVIAQGEIHGRDDIIAVTGWDFLLAEMYGVGPYEFVRKPEEGGNVLTYRPVGGDTAYTDPREFDIGDSCVGDEFIFQRSLPSDENFIERLRARVVHDYKENGGFIPRIMMMSKKGTKIEKLLKNNPVVAGEYRIMPIVEAHLRSPEVNAHYKPLYCTRKAESSVSRFDNEAYDMADIVADIVYGGDSAKGMGLDPDKGIVITRSNVVSVRFERTPISVAADD
tara:strand:- start:1397 stop:2344 length:948 start_codon:yes stop_codon:yes gene_type:complete